MRNTNLTSHQAKATLDYLHKTGIQTVAKLQRELEQQAKRGERDAKAAMRYGRRRTGRVDGLGE